MVSSQSQRPKGPSRLSLATEAKANFCHGMGCSRANDMGDWNMCEGTIDMEAYIGIVQRYILPCLSWEAHGYYIKTMPALIPCATTAWFHRQSDWPADLSPIENVWLFMKRRIRQ